MAVLTVTERQDGNLSADLTFNIPEDTDESVKEHIHNLLYGLVYMTIQKHEYVCNCGDVFKVGVAYGKNVKGD